MCSKHLSFVSQCPSFFARAHVETINLNSRYVPYNFSKRVGPLGHRDTGRVKKAEQETNVVE